LLKHARNNSADYQVVFELKKLSSIVELSFRRESCFSLAFGEGF